MSQYYKGREDIQVARQAAVRGWNDTSRGEDNEAAGRANELFRKLLKEKGYTIKEVVEDVERQHAGVDIVVTNRGGETFLVDEKTAVSAYNRDLRTFNLEVSTKNNPKEMGWFFDPNSQTTHYAFIFPRAKDKEMNEITSLQAILVSKEKIKQYLAKFGMNNRKDVLDTLNMDGRLWGESLKVHIADGVDITQSLDKREQPINILVSKDILRYLSEDIFKVEYEHKDTPKPEMPGTKANKDRKGGGDEWTK